jgi:alpha-1,3-glucan synthase
VDRDGVLDWLPPDSLAQNTINISSAPLHGYLGYRVVANDGTFGYTLQPIGSSVIQAIVIALLCVLPLLTAILGARSFVAVFYKVKFNRIGAEKTKVSFLHGTKLSTIISRFTKGVKQDEKSVVEPFAPSPNPDSTTISGLAADAGSPTRRKVLMATIEYAISDWNVKIKIGGLGVMSSLMADHATQQDLIWVVPCTGDVEYPLEEGE